ncbi:MAG: nucleoside 2-deoxyribosyltransferase domain-containing protein [Candidatus Pacebacteria bacterium]|jgi:hypothetical protein|nr:nucleoside 2-deoxyribosyltransferase domain-containing protein [Candidatus Paceibacterota bacterium]
MTEIKAPGKIPDDARKKIFLAGSIEVGTARNWQSEIVSALADMDIVILNPRREEWDSSWIQDKDNPEFHEQVAWELAALEASDHILMYYDPDTQSPISLMEEGLFARSGKLIIVCPEGFWKKGNVDIVSETYHIPEFETLTDAIAALRKKIVS